MQRGDRVAGRFELLENLARAGESRSRDVWRTRDEHSGRDVVLKMVEAGRGAAPHASSESRAMAKLNHPNVITFYYEVSDVHDWAVLEYAPGGSLIDKSMSPLEAAGIGAQIAGALAYIHVKGLLHCDVKPGNIVLTEDGTAKLTDFGSAYRLGSVATVSPPPQLSYTPGFVAPEQQVGRPEPASDVYALAATMYTLIMGRTPGQTLGTPDPGLGPLGDLLWAMLRPEPEMRPTAAEAQRSLQGIAEGLAAETTDPPSSTPRQNRPRIRTAAVALTGALVLVLLAGLGTLLVERPGFALWGAESPTPTYTITLRSSPSPTNLTPTPSPTRTATNRASTAPSKSHSKQPPRNPDPNPRRSDTCKKRELYQVTKNAEVVIDDTDESIGHVDPGDYFARTRFTTPPDPEMRNRYWGTVTTGHSEGTTGYMLIEKLAFIKSTCA